MNFLNDEPADQDLLGRDKVATAFKDYVSICPTPFVIGLYGTWGTGKTTLMKLIRKNLIDGNDNQNPKILTIWFDAWQYQTAENIELALLQKTYDAFKKIKPEISDSDKLRNSFIKAFNAFKAMTSVVSSITLSAPAFAVEVDMAKVLEQIKNFESKKVEQDLDRNQIICLVRDEFENFIRSVKDVLKVNRLVFCIDDLDRCSSKNAVRILEGIKNYMNIDGCVYILCMDKKALEKHLKKEGIAVSGEFEYLDKIIQLPFQIPVIDDKYLKNFMKELFPKKFSQEYIDLLLEGLGDNPRYIKRFVSTLNLGYHLIKEEFKNTPEEVEKILIFILLIQYCDPDRYRVYSYNRSLMKKHIDLFQKVDLSEDEIEEFNKIGKKGKIEKIFRKFPASDLIQEDKDYDIYFSYINSTEFGDTQKTLEESRKIGEEVKSKLKSHAQWLSHTNQENNQYKRLDLTKERLKDFDFSEIGDLTGAIFKQAWLNGAIFEKVTFNSKKYDINDNKSTNFTEVDLAYSKIKRADFENVPAWFSNFYRVEAEEVNFKGADLGSAKFEEATLNEAIFENSKLGGAQFNNAILFRANFKGAILYRASFKDADLRNADFENADLFFVQFDGADIDNADLSKVKEGTMNGGTIFQAKNLEKAKFDGKFWGDVVRGDTGDIKDCKQYTNILKKLNDFTDCVLEKAPFGLKSPEIEIIRKKCGSVGPLPPS